MTCAACPEPSPPSHSAQPSAGSWPRLAVFAYNAFGLLSFSVTSAIVRPSSVDVTAGYTALFLIWLAGALLLHLGLRRRWNAALTAILCFVTFGVFTTMGDHVVVGLIAAAQLWISLRLVPAYVAIPTVDKDAEDFAAFQAWKRGQAEVGARSVH